MNEQHKQMILEYLKTMPQTVSYSVDIGEEEIHVTWKKANIRAVAIFDEENEYSYTYYEKGHFVPGEHSVFIGQDWPADLLAYLRKNE